MFRTKKKKVFEKAFQTLHTMTETGVPYLFWKEELSNLSEIAFVELKILKMPTLKKSLFFRLFKGYVYPMLGASVLNSKMQCYDMNPYPYFVSRRAKTSLCRICWMYPDKKVAIFILFLRIVRYCKNAKSGFILTSSKSIRSKVFHCHPQLDSSSNLIKDFNVK